MYLSASLDSTKTIKWVHRSRYGSGRASSGMAGLDAPIFDVQCPTAAGGAPVDAAERRRLLRAAVLQAIELAKNAADKIDAAIRVTPRDRDAAAKQTERQFRFFFRHDPASPRPRNQESGVSIATRFRSVAKELNGGRRIVFHCRPPKDRCGDTDLTCCDPTENAWVHPSVPNAIHLCESFWNPAPVRGLPAQTLRAGIIIHEMLHIYYSGLLIDEGHGRRRAACYEAFALRVGGFAATRFDVCACRGGCRPAQPDWQP
jgi:hypothetical protein